ncbi:hypothetical protein [Thermomonospora amylolytica]|uniref:hypothetical protein n=1 Tax=Thermomonospora amylolytica TaxID=1411117 RepID=UPI000E6B70F2|nr:hypothetical protein [Thermomonospora amylolytica]
MIRSPRGHGYEIKVRGRISTPFREIFGDLAVTVSPAETVVYGPDLDQAALYGILERIQSLGLELVEVRRYPPRPPPPEGAGLAEGAD